MRGAVVVAGLLMEVVPVRIVVSCVGVDKKEASEREVGGRGKIQL